MLIFPPARTATTAVVSLLSVTAAGLNLISQQGRLQQGATPSDLLITTLLLLHALILLNTIPRRRSHQAAAALSILLATLTIT